MSDPLSYFAGDSSSDTDEEEEETAKVVSGNGSAGGEGDASKLPSPDTLFATVGRPSFLKDTSPDDIDWDKFVKSSEPVEADMHSVSGYSAIPPPSSAETQQASISAAPVKYTPADMDPKFRTVSSVGDHQTAGTKRAAEKGGGEEGGGGETKKLKIETFRTKEKRKRDLGQTSRGKSYVEEEKRILRQAYGSDEIMN